jgi:putative membrane protein
MKLWKYLAWLFRALLFVALLLFALKNTEPVTLRFYLEQSWQAPLVLVLLAFLALGAALGVMACLTKLFAQRREIQSLKKAAQSRQALQSTGVSPAVPSDARPPVLPDAPPAVDA